VLEFSERQKKKLKKTLDTAGVVRDTAFIRTYPEWAKLLGRNLDIDV